VGRKAHSYREHNDFGDVWGPASERTQRQSGFERPGYRGCSKAASRLSGKCRAIR